MTTLREAIEGASCPSSVNPCCSNCRHDRCAEHAARKWFADWLVGDEALQTAVESCLTRDLVGTEWMVRTTTAALAAALTQEGRSAS